MVKLAWKIINGYGPYAYLQKSVKFPDGKVVSEHIKYLGSLSKPKIDVDLTPGKSFKWRGESIAVPQLPADQKKQLKPGPLKKYETLADQTITLGSPVAPKSTSGGSFIIPIV